MHFVLAIIPQEDVVSHKVVEILESYKWKCYGTTRFISQFL